MVLKTARVRTLGDGSKEIPQTLQPMFWLGMGVRIRGTLGDIDPLKKVPCERVKRCPEYDLGVTKSPI